MPTPTSPDPPTTLKLRSPADLVALVPYLLGFHPSQSLCLVGLNDSKVTCAIRYDLPEADDIEAFTAELTAMIADKPINVVLLAGYGTDAEVTPTLTATLAALAAIEIPAVEALRVDHGRYFPYLCGDKTCCPPEGTPYEIDTSAVAATAVTCGLSALPDRSDLAKRITPQQGTARAAVEAATAQAADARTRRTMRVHQRGPRHHHHRTRSLPRRRDAQRPGRRPAQRVPRRDPAARRSLGHDHTRGGRSSARAVDRPDPPRIDQRGRLRLAAGVRRMADRRWRVRQHRC